MKEKMEYEEFAGMFGMWAEMFRPFIEGEEFYNIYQKIKDDAFEMKDDKLIRKEYIVPSNDVTFRAFGVSNPKLVKSVWYLMDPYPKRYRNKAYQATGIAMDCSNSPDGKIQPSLELFYRGIERDLDIEVDHHPSLEYLLNQGILLLNTDFTCKLNKTGSHVKLWEPFQKYFLEEVMGGNTGIIYVLAGNESHRMEKYINPLSNYIYKLEHPMAGGRKNTDWNHKSIFSTINKHIKENNNEEVYWDRRQWERSLEPPF